MSSTSWAGNIVDIESGAFAAGDPVNAAQAFLLRNNLAHLVDVSTQPRLSWVGLSHALGALEYSLISAHPSISRNRCICAQEFPLTFLAEDRPAGLVVSAAFTADSIESSNTDYSYRVVVVPAHTRVGEGNDLALVDVQGTQTAGVATSLVGIHDLSDKLETLRGAWDSIGVSDDGDQFREIQLCMLRFEIQLRFPIRSDVLEDYNTYNIRGAALWEFG